MKNRQLKILSVYAMAIVGASAVFAVAQGPARGGGPQAGGGARGGGAAPAPAAAATPFTPARTPDGQPDMQGMYTRSGTKAAEATAVRENTIDPGGGNPLSVSNRGDGLGPYPNVFGQVGTVLRGGGGGGGARGGARGGAAGGGGAVRRSGIIDPADRVLPWKPEEDAKRRQHLLEMNPPKDLRHIEFNSRCALPGPFEGEDNANPYLILQRPGSVVILYDYNHTPRTIHLNRTEHIGKNIRLFMGDSIGRWEGNTLIVDTTNFNGKIAFSRPIPYLSEQLHLTERFTVADANTIDYEVTIDDPGLFNKPWKVAGNFSRAAKDTESLEFACAEGSQTLQNIFGLPPVR